VLGSEERFLLWRWLVTPWPVGRRTQPTHDTATCPGVTANGIGRSPHLRLSACCRRSWSSHGVLPFYGIMYSPSHMTFSEISPSCFWHPPLTYHFPLVTLEFCLGELTCVRACISLASSHEHSTPNQARYPHLVLEGTRLTWSHHHAMSLANGWNNSDAQRRAGTSPSLDVTDYKGQQHFRHQ